jgi:hypothetical protein
MHNNLTKICEICQVLFTPDPRVGERQRVCQKRDCQQGRKRRAQKKWLAKNPDAFQGRYPKLQQWLAQHPGYLKNYRASRLHPQPAPFSGDIQDELSVCQTNLERCARDIQDEISAKISSSRHHLDLSAGLLRDIQDELTAWATAT